MAHDKSPLHLQPEKSIAVSRMSKKPLYSIMGLGVCLLAVLVYSVNFAHNEEDAQQVSQEVEIKETDTPLLMGEGTGLSLKPPSVAVVAAPEEKRKDEKKEPLVLVTREAPATNQELENIRRIRSQAYISALSAPLTVKVATNHNNNAGASYQPASQSQGNSLGKTQDVVANSDYDPAADNNKESFYSRAESRDIEWISTNERKVGQPFELKTGAVIPGVMVTGINSDLPGNMIAQISQNIYDSAKGKHLLIPQGSKLYGVYDSRVIYGQSRVLIAWNRIIFPDGSSITLGAMPGADMSGYAGYNDQVSNHYGRIFGSALLMSLVMGGSAYAMDMANSSGSGDKVSMSDEMISSLSAQFGQTTTTILQKNLNIKPTLEIRPGYQFSIVVTKDLVFDAPYSSWSKQP